MQASTTSTGISLKDVVAEAKALDSGDARIAIESFHSASTTQTKKAAAAGGAAAEAEGEEEEMVVTAHDVKGKIDYEKLIKEFGSQRITDEHLAQMEELTVGRGRVPHLHRFLRRGMFFSHRDIAAILSSVGKAKAGEVRSS